MSLVFESPLALAFAIAICPRFRTDWRSGVTRAAGCRERRRIRMASIVQLLGNADNPIHLILSIVLIIVTLAVFIFACRN